MNDSVFQGFSQEAVEFLWQLRFNNERSWFEPRKEEYRRLLQEPLRRLGAEVQAEVSRRHPEYPLNLHVSRIYRDSRRLHGRGPYKDHLWIVLHRPKDEAAGTVPAFYFEIAPEYYSIGMGYYSATPLTMAKLRARIDRAPAEMERLARRLNRQGDFRLEGEVYRRDKGDKGELLNLWYNRKNICLCWDRPCEGTLFARELLDEIVDGVDFLMPFYKYFASLDAEPDPNS